MWTSGKSQPRKCPPPTHMRTRTRPEDVLPPCETRLIVTTAALAHACTWKQCPVATKTPDAEDMAQCRRGQEQSMRRQCPTNQRDCRPDNVTRRLRCQAWCCIGLWLDHTPMALRKAARSAAAHGTAQPSCWSVNILFKKPREKDATKAHEGSDQPAAHPRTDGGTSQPPKQSPAKAKPSVLRMLPPPPAHSAVAAV